MGTLASELRPIAQELAAAPRVYADANMPARVVSVMRKQLRWDVLFVMEHDDLRRASDAFHFSRALDLGRTLVTQDHDFLDARRFPPEPGPGVIVCSATDERSLLRLLRHADRKLLRPDAPRDLPLKGQTVELTTDVLRP